MKHLFFGGIHPKYNKEMSTGVTDFRTVTPETVVIPMVQHIGAPCRPLVAVGDRVLLGQKIGDGEGLCVPVHASVSGTVTAIEEYPHPNGRKVLSVVIRNDFQDEAVPAAEARIPVEQMEIDRILHTIREAGIVGMGSRSRSVTIAPIENCSSFSSMVFSPKSHKSIAVPTAPLPRRSHSIPPRIRLRLFWLSCQASSRLWARTYF